jgi:hypothetical protein
MKYGKCFLAYQSKKETRMSASPSEFQQRLNFIDRTICHAAQACHSDTNVPGELKEFVHQLGLHASHAMQALQCHDETAVRQLVDALTRLSFHAQKAIRHDVNYDVKSAVILAHLELSALMHQLD